MASWPTDYERMVAPRDPQKLIRAGAARQFPELPVSYVDFLPGAIREFERVYLRRKSPHVPYPVYKFCIVHAALLEFARSEGQLSIASSSTGSMPDDWAEEKTSWAHSLTGGDFRSPEEAVLSPMLRR